MEGSMKFIFKSQILVFVIIVALLGSINTYAQEASAGPIPQIYLNKNYSKTPLQNTTGDNPLATLAYGYGAQLLQTLSMPLPAGQPFTNLAAFTFPSFASSMTKGGDGNYYLTTTYNATGPVTPKLYTVSTAGVVTLLGDITGTGTNSVNGISYNPNNGNYYIISSTSLYSLNISTRVATLIGNFGITNGLMIDFCFDYAGNCYGEDLGTDNAYTINISTGVATLLGPLGFDANYGQGMGYDFENGWIYLSAFQNSPLDGQLRVMDPQTGYTNKLASYGLNQVAPFAPASTIAALAGPGRATNPAPVNGAIGVLHTTGTINWTNALGATSVQVFFGTDPLNLPSIYSGAVVTSRPVTLNYGTTYYWYVSETSGAGTTKGTLWSFTTEAAPCPVANLPVIQDFETGVFPPLCWTNTGAIWLSNTYTGVNVSGYGIGSYSALADFYEISSGTSDLISLDYNSTGASNPVLKFDWAYATYINDPDEMDIYYSTNAGATWTILLAMPGGLNGILNPYHLATTDPYFPANNEWSTKTIPLPAGTNKVKFTAVTGYGNLLWLDNIKISGESFFDNFESYTVGQQLACQATPVWTTWSNLPCSPIEDPYISSTYAFSPTKSVKIVQDNDLVKPLGNKTTGKWYISFFMYVPTGKAGYFNTLAVAPPSADWGMEVYFDAGGGGRLMNVPGAPINFSWHDNTWNQVMVVVDFTQTPTTAEFWFGKVGQLAQLFSWDWTQTGTVTDQLGGNDFFGATAGDEMYVDDYYFSDVPPPIQQLANDVGTLSIDMAYQYGPGTITPMATVKNYGTAANSFNVQMTISGGYSSTKTVSNLASGTTQQVTFDPWTQSTVGAYTINVCTQLATDDNPDNNCLSQGVHIWDPSGDWTSGADYPITTYNGTGVSYNDGTTNWLFVIGGNTTSGLRTECYKYNVTTNTWTPIAPLPAGRLIFAAVAVGNYIYVIGGSDGTVYTNTTYRYDIAGNTWTLLPAVVPTTIGWCRAVSYQDRYIYIAGGYDGTSLYLNTVYLYDTVTGTYTTASPMPLAVFGGGFGITGTTLVYAAGAYESGISNTVMVGTINSGSPALISWSTMENKYPGIGKEVCDQYGASLVAEMLQSAEVVNNHSTDAMVWPAGAIYRTHAHTWGNDAIIMGGGTPTSNYPQTGPSPCYIYKPATDTWIAQENVPVTIGAHQSGTVHVGNTWKYIIASGYGTTAAVSATQIYTQTLGANTFALSVNVTLGWNMVSAPGNNPAGMGVGTWWPHKTGTVWGFNGVQYVAKTVAVPGEGYWMKNTLAETYNYPAIEIVAHNPIPVTLGWNMIGGYEMSPTIVALKAANPQITGTVWGFNGVQYVAATNLVPGYSYWAKVTSAGTITIPDAMAKGNGEVASEYIKEDLPDGKAGWGKIILTDATGLNFTLYAVKGEVDLDQYELPPLPPAGAFDIRFSSGRIAEDINSSVKTIDMTGVTYPLTLRVEGMDIRLMDETGKMINLNLKKGEDVVISDAKIQKLMVSGELIPDKYSLEQNYPNPFNPSTVIEFSLPENVSNVRLTIYSILGEKVAELVNTSLVAGKYSYTWNANNVSTGMYIYELRTDKFVSIKKMLLLK
jgi:hypothetical protein